MDELSAHLDRGWDLVQRGDSRGAELSARRALEIDDQSPEAYNLLGYAAALQGEFDDAVEHYGQALAYDDTYLEAMLNAAEVYIHPLGDFAAALRLCSHALEVAESDEEIIDTLLLEFDARLGLQDLEGAQAVCRRFPSGPFANPTHSFLVGRAFHEVGDTARAAPLIETAARATPPNPEALYYLGLIRDEAGDVPGATQAFLEALALDRELAPPPWALSVAAFAQLVERSVSELDERWRTLLAPGELYVSDLPGVEVVADGVDPRAVLMLDVISPPGAEKPVARLFVYQRNLERVAGTLERIQPELSGALEREIRVVLLGEQLDEPQPAPVVAPHH